MAQKSSIFGSIGCPWLLQQQPKYGRKFPSLLFSTKLVRFMTKNILSYILFSTAKKKRRIAENRDSLKKNRFFSISPKKES